MWISVGLSGYKHEGLGGELMLISVIVIFIARLSEQTASA